MWFDDRDDLEAEEADEAEQDEDVEEEPGTLQCFPHAREIFGEIITIRREEWS